MGTVGIQRYSSVHLRILLLSSISCSFLFFLSFFGGTGRKGLTQRRNSADKSIGSSEEQPSQQAPESSREMSLPWGNLCMEG